MRRKIKTLLRQNSKWEIIDEFTFRNRNYEVDEYGNFYRNGKQVKVKPNWEKSLTFGLTDDLGILRRFKLHQIVYQVFGTEKLRDYFSVDHINKNNRLDNSIFNLRLADRKTQYSNRENKVYKYKKVFCLNNDKIYNSCQEAEKDLKLVKNTVSRVARGERKSIRGYKFEYV